MPAVKRSSELVVHRRLHDEPLGGDARLPVVLGPGHARAVDTARSRSAEASTTNGSEPPSSRTHFFRAWPAAERHRLAGPLAAGQGDGHHPVVGDDAGHRTRTDQQGGEDTLGEPGPPEQVLQQ